jgi:hypothetical protein
MNESLYNLTGAEYAKTVRERLKMLIIPSVRWKKPRKPSLIRLCRESGVSRGLFSLWESGHVKKPHHVSVSKIEKKLAEYAKISDALSSLSADSK